MNTPFTTSLASTSVRTNKRPRVAKISKVELKNIGDTVASEIARRKRQEREQFEELVRPLANDIMATKVGIILDEFAQSSLAPKVNYLKVWKESVTAAKVLLKARAI